MGLLPFGDDRIEATLFLKQNTVNRNQEKTGNCSTVATVTVRDFLDWVGIRSRATRSAPYAESGKGKILSTKL